jgi:hypothetical protein
LIPGIDVANGRQAACAVRLVANMLRPAYAYRSAITSLRPVYMHASVIAVSTASVPLFVKNEQLSLPGAICAKRRAISTCCSLMYRVDM